MKHRISINTLCLEPASLGTQIDLVARLGAGCIGLGGEDIAPVGAQAAKQMLRDAGLSVALLTHRAFGFASPQAVAEQRDRMNCTIDTAQAIGAHAICFTSGPRGNLNWHEAAERFAEAIAPCAEQARAAGVLLGLEPTSHLYADSSIVHRLSDVVTLTDIAGINVGMDLFCCWVDSDIETAIARAAPNTAFVQLSDYVAGDRGLPCRAVLGDGMVPVERLVRLILQAGYTGPFDLEVIGPRLHAEGAEIGLRRCIDYLEQVLGEA
jgi:sugar phosphate isomerase/epimerase